MSREVEVQNIQMTATTPEDIQISLGKIGSDATTVSESESYMLGGSTGVLMNTAGVVADPRNNVDHDELDWSNIADISKYYQFGKLIPASSTDGENVYFTPDAAGVGRTLKATAGFYQAAAATTEYKYDSANSTFASNGGGDTAKATAYVDNTSGGNDATWTTPYSQSTSWTETNDDGYYIDIPVWLRTSSTQAGGTPIYVSGYVTDNAEENNGDSDDLYKAVRVAILTDAGTADKGCLTLKDGGDTYIDPVTGQATHSTAFPAYSNDANILDSANYNGRYASAVAGTIYAVNSTTTSANGNVVEVGHGTIVQNNADSTNAVTTLAAGTGTAYGTATKLIIRVWLEGEDGNCWNENAGQDWNIALKFSKEPLTAQQGG
jgi:hypothetical protein